MNIDRIVKNATERAQDVDFSDFYTLLRAEILTDEIKGEIYNRFLSDSNELINKYLNGCHDTNKDKGMSKCALETWQACITSIGINYYKKYKLLDDYYRNRESGSNKYNSELLYIGLEVYEQLCNEYRKQFFIYDCCRYLGVSKETMYKLNTSHGDFLKMAHSSQEASMRTALASGRSNVTAMAILLNHDYDYTRTTQIIHSSERIQTASDLPTLNEAQDIIEIPLKKPPKNLENI